MKSERSCLHLFAQPYAPYTARAYIHLVDFFNLSRDLSLAKMRVVQREFQHCLFEFFAGAIFVMKVVGCLSLKSLRTLLAKDLFVPVDSVA